MSCRPWVALVALLSCVIWNGSAEAIQILSPADSIIAIDTDPPGSNSNYPAGEAPVFAFDDDTMGTKYLNFAGAGSGVILTPSFSTGAAVSTIVDGIEIWTGNDAPNRDPTSFEVWGTNDAIMSLDGSTGLGESWTLIAADAVPLQPTRNASAGLISFANTDLYESYKIIFPTVNGSSLFQANEIELYGDVPSFSAFDQPLTQGATPTLTTPLAVHFATDSNYPGGEAPAFAIDGDPYTKYLNFGAENSGFIVTPAGGPEAVKTIQIFTANDAPERDPSGWELYGTNDAILSGDNSQGDGEAWTLVDTGTIDLPLDRNTTPGDPLYSGFADVDNDTAYNSYRLVFTGLRDAEDANSAQYAEVQFYSTQVPEPSTALLGGFAVLAGIGIARFRK